MLNFLYKITFLILTQFVSVSLISGQKTQVKFDAKITEISLKSNKINSVNVYIFKNNLLNDSILVNEGRFKYNLEDEAVYKILFSKNGYASKHLVISTKNTPRNANKNSKLKVDVGLFKIQEGLDVDFLNEKPVGIARYNEYSKKLKWDEDYTRRIINLIINATLNQFENNK